MNPFRHKSALRTLGILLLGLSLLFGANAALLAGVAESGQGERILLCTPAGFKWVDVEAWQQGEAVESSCPWCRLEHSDDMVPVILAVSVLTMALPQNVAQSVHWPAQPPLSPVPDPRAEPGSPRAPPRLLT